MGTRFLATPEANAHAVYKASLVTAHEEDTVASRASEFGATGQSIESLPAGKLIWRNTANAIAGATIPTTLFFTSSAGVTILEGVDLSALGSNTIVPAGTSGNTQGLFYFIDCKLGSGAVIAATPINIGGAAATGSAGSFTPTIADTLTGAAATTSAGSLTPSLPGPVTGAAATSAAGTLAETVAETFTGAAATASASGLNATLLDTLGGAAATGSAGSFTPTLADTLTGVAATASAGALSETVAVTLPGTAAASELRVQVLQTHDDD
jgi:hypothetical protein